MNQICEEKKCTGCGACVQVCPQKCIEMKFDALGFLFPVIDKIGCIDCNTCINVCPSINPDEKNTIDLSFKSYSLDRNILLRSTSGGIFSELSIEVINRGGVVFGAAFDKKFNVKHEYVSTENDLDKLCGSKYIQSNTVDSFILVKRFLKENRPVLYTGTPCQIAGLKRFLKKEYSNLILCDFLCHGVGSTRVFHEYLDYLSSKCKSTPQIIMFRDKVLGYKKSQFTVLFENKKYFSCHSSQTAFTYGFASKLLIRESCVTCKYTGVARVSDITIADYAGSDLYMEEKKYGASIILCNTEKGKSFVSTCKDRLYLQRKSLNEIIEFTNNLKNSGSYRNPKRELFFRDLLNGVDFDELKNRYLKVPMLMKVSNFRLGKQFVLALLKLKNILK